ncbi:endonuclease domain-containing protein [Gordonia liuliyuniae]|uniref:DUF559 domain-containing protein n=1 Tax=Gordonia liuliyuniae TaxID=2911517 RepID=A0ABS9IVM3_9ACTN|nr:hypothetical protein [Gordonia liuliyuniae]MCF8589527.1 hypothetical protein [Gordonia liuliyuniae]MCF8589937.1 hypothetical protein [Gordonia liuliyuniae]
MDTGVYSRGQMLARWPRREIDRAITDGRLVSLRRRWWARLDADPDVVRAVRAGGVLTCTSALRRHGVWVPPTDRLHIRGNDATSRLRPDWCRQHGRQPAECEAVDDLPTALLHAARCLPSEDFVVICDSVLNRQLMSATDLAVLFATHPKCVVHSLELCDGRADSGTESMVRLRLRAPNLKVRPQVYIPGVGKVDFVVGRSMLIEVDGFEYHAAPHAFENDRLRDLHARALGYDPIRLTYTQVVHQWSVVGPLLAEMIRRGDHQRRLPTVVPTRIAREQAV